ncbi:MAG TPA: hypothetical protein VHD69_00425 [Candidatus Paceibacterota bacterium]|nr:hypothetical protein [Candidatus Paceibacterota bacterium]
MNNEKNYGMWAVGAIVVILIGLSMYFWANRDNGIATDATSTPSGSTMILPYGTATLALGQQGVFPGITIIPLSVSQDSRCAAGVQCIWAGTVQVVVRSAFDNGASRQDVMTLGSTTSVGDFSVSLVSVQPEARADVDIKDADYRFTFDVHQSADGVTLEGKG